MSRALPVDIFELVVYSRRHGQRRHSRSCVSLQPLRQRFASYSTTESLLAMGGERYWISLVDIVVLVVEVCFPVSPSVRLWCWVVVLLVMASPPKT